jgi:hypothetical protein
MIISEVPLIDPVDFSNFAECGIFRIGRRITLDRVEVRLLERP